MPVFVTIPIHVTIPLLISFPLHGTMPVLVTVTKHVTPPVHVHNIFYVYASVSHAFYLSSSRNEDKSSIMR